MKIEVCVFTLLCCICLTLNASAFDGNRKGFVLGGGVGFTPNVENSGKGLAWNLMLGQAWMMGIYLSLSLIAVMENYHTTIKVCFVSTME